MNRLRVGVVLPSFTVDADAPFAAAAAAERTGLDGVFAFDHMWPMGSPGRPALWSFGLLAAVAARTERVHVGPLVARVGLMPDGDLLDAFDALVAIAGRERVIAGVGTGDHLSAAENVAYGVDYPPAATRLADLQRVATVLVQRRLVTWVGGRSPDTAEVARLARAGRNLWGVATEELAAASARHGEVLPLSWGGLVLVGRDRTERDELLARFGERPWLLAGTVGEVAERLTAYHAAGAAWCVCAPLDYIARPEAAVESIGLVRQSIP